MSTNVNKADKTCSRGIHK